MRSACGPRLASIMQAKEDPFYPDHAFLYLLHIFSAFTLWHELYGSNKSFELQLICVTTLSGAAPPFLNRLNAIVPFSTHGCLLPWPFLPTQLQLLVGARCSSISFALALGCLHA